MIGAEFVARSAPDGYTLLFSPQSPVAALPFLVKDMPYDALKAFAPVSLVAQSPNVFVVAPEVPIRSFAPCVSGATRTRFPFTYVPLALARSCRTKNPRSKTTSAWCRDTLGSRRMMSFPGSRPTVNGLCVCRR